MSEDTSCLAGQHLWRPAPLWIQRRRGRLILPSYRTLWCWNCWIVIERPKDEEREKAWIVAVLEEKKAK